MECLDVYKDMNIKNVNYIQDIKSGLYGDRMTHPIAPSIVDAVTLKIIIHVEKQHMLNKLRPRQNGRHFANDIFKRIFVNENIWILINNSLKFVPKDSINNIPALVQIMAWRRPGDKPLSEPMMVNLPTHICVTRPQWVNEVYMLTADRDNYK